MKFFIKDENNNTFQIIKTNNNRYEATYDLVNFNKNQLEKDVNKEDKILFNNKLINIKHSNKLEAELFSLFFSVNSGFSVSFKRNFNSTYVKMISTVEDKYEEKKDEVVVCFTIYDEEFNNLDFNEFVAYHFTLLSLLNTALLKMIDSRNKFTFNLNSAKISAINSLYKRKNLKIEEILDLIYLLKNGKEEEFE